MWDWCGGVWSDGISRLRTVGFGLRNRQRFKGTAKTQRVEGLSLRNLSVLCAFAVRNTFGMESRVTL